MDPQRTIDEIRMLQMEQRREEMIRWLIEEKKFGPKAAAKCIANFLESMRYVLEETGRLPVTQAVTIIIAGEPIALARPRFHNVKTRGGREFVSTYQPAHSKKYQTHVRMAAQQAMDGRDPLEGPLALNAIIVMPIPKSLSKRKHAQALIGGLRPTTRPDCSNLLKNAEDGLNGIVYRDDNQIVELQVSKVYGDKPQMKLVVTPLHLAVQVPMPLFGDSA